MISVENLANKLSYGVPEKPPGISESRWQAMLRQAAQYLATQQQNEGGGGDNAEPN